MNFKLRNFQLAKLPKVIFYVEILNLFCSTLRWRTKRNENEATHMAPTLLLLTQGDT